ncbi:hypothetical protein FHU30_007559 [Actinomadura rupiterrae]|nr:hypothetical protein [Actinomadura rupiterrae]
MPLKRHPGVARPFDKLAVHYQAIVTGSTNLDMCPSA